MTEPTSKLRLYKIGITTAPLFREARDWYQVYFAARADVHGTYISDIERGRRNPTVTVVEKLSVP